MEAEIIAVGTELLSFARTETNSLYITSVLKSFGIEVRKKTVIGDREDDLQEVFLEALKGTDIVILSGGLGPTTDDITREVVASSLGRKLYLDEAVVGNLKKRYKRFGFKLTENNRKQAMVPEAARILPNPRGTAPGLFLEENSRLVFLLPGPPRELYPMMDSHVVSIIQEFKEVNPIPMQQLKIAGEAESKVDSAIAGIYSKFDDIETTILSSPGIISLYFQWKGIPDTEFANSRLDELSQRIRKQMGPSVYSDHEESIEEAVGTVLEKNHLTLATAESCTGGYIGKMLTDIPGSSSYYLGGVISYSNEIKTSVLGVHPSSIEEHGAVSKEVASQMASGVRKLMDSDVGIAITGIAGPDGGSKDKPVGTLYLGLSLNKGARIKATTLSSSWEKGTEHFSGSSGAVTEVKKLFLPGTREAVRLRSSRMALDWIRRILS